MMQTYDYVVVGSGSGGAVVAERLSAGGRYTVLVLEAGGSDRRFYVRMPLGYGKCFMNPEVNWNYRPEPDPGIGGRIDHWPRGKVLGGSSSINAMVWIRGHRADFDGWRDEGNAGWGYEDVLPVFKALEDNEAGEDEWRARGGPVHVTDITGLVHPLCHRYLRAAQQLGLRFNPDFNGADQEGVGIYQITTRNGRRVSAASAFLHPASKRLNLRVETRAHATRIIIENGRACAVEYVQGGQVRRVRAGREVIVSAGSINSPQLLQLSGIGPEAALRDQGIPVVLANANVGAHLQDHQGINYTWKARVPTLNQILRPWWGRVLAGSRYLLTRGGPLSMSMNQGGGFLRTDPALARPNIQLYFKAATSILPRPGDGSGPSLHAWPGFSIGVSNCRPSSRGSVTLRSPDPLAPPRILVNALSTGEDVAEMLAAVKFLRRLAQADALAEVVAEEVVPGPSVHGDEALVEDIRRRSGTVFHPVATCRMGPDPSCSVVSPRLKVHGIEGLRVVDGSVFPRIIAGNTNATAMMVGWKGADMILEDAR